MSTQYYYHIQRSTSSIKFMTKNSSIFYRFCTICICVYNTVNCNENHQYVGFMLEKCRCNLFSFWEFNSNIYSISVYLDNFQIFSLFFTSNWAHSYAVWYLWENINPAIFESLIIKFLADILYYQENLQLGLTVQ